MENGKAERLRKSGNGERERGGSTGGRLELELGGRRGPKWRVFLSQERKDGVLVDMHREHTTVINPGNWAPQGRALTRLVWCRTCALR